MKRKRLLKARQGGKKRKVAPQHGSAGRGGRNGPQRKRQKRQGALAGAAAHTDRRTLQHKNEDSSSSSSSSGEEETDAPHDSLPGQQSEEHSEESEEEEEDAAENASRKRQRSESRPEAELPHGYSPGQRVLLVGEGDFTFARALVRLFGGRGAGLVATTLDSREETLRKYEGDTQAVQATLRELEEAGVRLRFGINACRLAQTLAAGKKKGGLRPDELAFDRITFNFPHVGRGIKDEAVNIAKNQELLAAFFRSACGVLRPSGEIHVALREGLPYSRWNVVGTAVRATGHLLRHRAVLPLNAPAFPGYQHQRTRGRLKGDSAAQHEAAFVAGAKTYVFAPDPSAAKQ